MVEEARRNKLVGASLEARVLLHIEQAHLAESLSTWNALPNGADPLRYTFIVSQVCQYAIGMQSYVSSNTQVVHTECALNSFMPQLACASWTCDPYYGCPHHPHLMIELNIMGGRHEN